MLEFFCCLLYLLHFTIVAENDALRKTLKTNSNEDDTTMIPRPEKGVVYKGFNLQEAMGLADDDETYGVLRVSLSCTGTYLLSSSRL